MTTGTEPNHGMWRKSSYSNGDGGDCVEVAAPWIKSSYSNGDGGNCVEVATPAHALLVRDSKRPTGPTLTFHHPTWHTFLTQLRETGPVRA